MQEGSITDHRLCRGHEREGGDQVSLKMDVIEIAVELVGQETANPHQLSSTSLVCT